MIKNLKIRSKRIKRVKVIKSSIFSLSIISVILAGCSNVNTNDYYLVCEDSNYYICKKVGTFNKSDDYEFESILDGQTIGSICSKRDNFNYENHRFSTNFLCELQVVSMKEVFCKESISIDELLDIANNRINEVGDNYFKNSKYYFNSDFEFDKNTNLKLFNYDGTFILGYDISPRRLNDNSRYIYSIKDLDVIKTEYESSLEEYDINLENKKNAYISYSEALDLLNSDKLEKILKK